MICDTLAESTHIAVPSRVPDGTPEDPPDFRPTRGISDKISDFGPEISDNPDINLKFRPNVVSINRILAKFAKSKQRCQMSELLKDLEKDKCCHP
jgi:hypothetical protein